MDAEGILPAFSRNNGVTVTEDLQAEFAAHRREVLTRITLLVARLVIAAEMRKPITEWEKDAAG